MYILHINHKSIFIPLFKASSLFSGAILTVNPLSNFREHLITLQFTPGSEGRSGCSQLRGFGSHTRLDHRNLYKAFPLLVQHGHGTPPRFMVSIAKTTKKGGWIVKHTGLPSRMGIEHRRRYGNPLVSIFWGLLGMPSCIWYEEGAWFTQLPMSNLSSDM